MSSLNRNEMSGINLIWKLENFNNESGIYYNLFNFIWPSNDCQIELYYEGQYTSKQYIWFELIKGNGLPFTFFGTISVIMAENSTHVLRKFEYDELYSLELELDLKSIPCPKDILHPNNCLTLLVQLWDNPVMNINATYYALSRPIVKKYRFKWCLDIENALTRDSVPKYTMKVPGMFKDTMGQQDIRLALEIYLGKFSKSYSSTSNYINFVISEPFINAAIKCKVDAINKCGFSQILLDTEFFRICGTVSDRFELLNIQDIKSKKHLYYPNGYVTINCKVDTMIFPEAEVKAVEYMSDIYDPIEFYKQIDENYETVHKDTPVCETLNESLFNLYREDQFCDITLRVEEKALRCHKMVLCARSSVFKAMFQRDMREKEQFVDILNVDFDTMQMFLTALYTDKFEDVDWDDAIKLYSLADKYEVSFLQKRCSVLLLSGLSVPNFCELLEFADVHQDETLKEQIKEFFFEHVLELIKLPAWNELMLRRPLLIAQMMHLAFSKFI